MNVAAILDKLFDGRPPPDAERLINTGLFLPPPVVPVGCEVYAREIAAQQYRRKYTSGRSAILHREGEAIVQANARRPTLTHSEVRRIIAEVKAEILAFRTARGLPVD